MDFNSFFWMISILLIACYIIFHAFFIVSLHLSKIMCDIHLKSSLQIDVTHFLVPVEVHMAYNIYV